jgi:cold shock CspA family protein
METPTSTPGTTTVVSVTTSAVAPAVTQAPDPLAFIKQTGVIKSVRPDGSYAFLTDSQGVDRFFHQSAMNNTADFDILVPGVYVFFTPLKHAKGPRASRVHLVA